MRHRKHSIRFGRQRSHYKATLRHLVSGLIINKSISTTKTKAKQASRLAERLVTIGKQNCVANQRKAYSVLRDRDLVFELFNEIAPLFKDRNGGYTRVMLSRRRAGDNAQMAILEFVEKPPEAAPLAKKEEKKKKETKAIQPEPKARPEKKEERKPPKPKKEKIIKKKQEPEKEIGPPKPPEKPAEKPKEPERPKEPEKKPGFFKRLFGGKKK